MKTPEPSLPVTESRDLGLNHHLSTGSALRITFLSAADAVESTQAQWSEAHGTTLVGLALPFQTPRERLTVARVELDLDRWLETMLEEREQRVMALRDWLDSLPDVPAIPADAIDRSELY